MGAHAIHEPLGVGMSPESLDCYGIPEPDLVPGAVLPPIGGSNRQSRY